MPYENQMRILNILPLPMYMQKNDLLTLSKLTQEGGDDIEIHEINKNRKISADLYTLIKVRFEKGAIQTRFQKLQTSKPNRQ